VALPPLSVYVFGACRTAYVGDSGDLLTAVAVLGIPHPSGYPLYVLVGKLWSLLLGFLPLPWSLSLLSAACASAACGVLYRVCRETGVAALPAAGSAWLLAFAPSFWGEANIQRVYALNALFVALALLSAFRWEAGRRDRDLVAAAFVCGLGASNHLEMGLVGLVVAAFAVLTEPAILRRGRFVAACLGAAAAGLLPYVYLPLRARAHPLLAWGDPATPGRFLAVVLREDFWGRAWIRGIPDLGPILADYGRSLLRESAWIGAGLAAIGVVASRRRRLLLPLGIMAANVGVLALHGSRSDLFIWHRYYAPSYLALALLAAWGWQALAPRVGPVLRLAPLAAPAVLLAGGFASFDRSRYRIAEDYSRSVLATLPPGSQLIASDDNILFVLMFLNLGEGLRPDINLILEGVGGARLGPLAFDPDRDPVFLTHYPNWNFAGLEAVPLGLVFRAWRAGRPPPGSFRVPERLDGELDPRVPKDYLTQNLIGNFHYMRGLTAEGNDWPRARLEFAEAASAAPENDVLFYNLGLIFRRNGLLEDALAAFRKSAQINPREIASRSRPRASDRAAEVEQEITERDRFVRSLESDPSLAGSDRGTLPYRQRLAALLRARGQLSWARGAELRGLVESPARTSPRAIE
jgi:tetratricopeptide (TPR) repeat protein